MFVGTNWDEDRARSEQNIPHLAVKEDTKPADQFGRQMG
jgi:hypothetical protein